ncbi:MAG: hypothetical protein ACU85U_00865 [Gammaproteobacteria bacterium]
MLLLSAFVAACSQPSTPVGVASGFWTAVEAGDARMVKRRITAAEAASLESLDDVLPISGVELGRIIIDGHEATIDTTVTVTGDKPLDFPLKTYLVLEDEDWKVDYARTTEAVANAGKLAAVIEKVHEFGSTLQLGIERSVQELEHTLPQIEQELSRIENQIKQNVPELRKRLEQFSQDLEEAMKRQPETSPPVEPGTEGSIEI